MGRPSASTNFLLIVFVMLSVFTSDLYLSSLPAFVEIFGTYPERAQLILSAYFTGFSFSMLFCGPLTDRFGRRNMMLFGLSLYVVATLLCLVATDLTMLIMGRFLQSFGGCCGSIISRIIAKDHYGKQKDAAILSRLLSGMFIGMAAAAVLSPFCGSILLTHFGWRANFIVLALVGSALLYLTYWKIEETRPERGVLRLTLFQLVLQYGDILRNRQFLLYSSIITCVWTGFFAFESGAPFVVMDLLGSSPTAFGGFYAVAMGGFIAGATISRQFATKESSSQCIFWGLSCCLAGGSAQLFIGLVFGEGVYQFIFPMFIYLLGVGLVLSHCQVLAIEPFKKSASYSFSLLYFSKMICGSLGGWLVVLQMKGSYMPLAFITFFMALLGIFLYVGSAMWGEEWDASLAERS